VNDKKPVCGLEIADRTYLLTYLLTVLPRSLLLMPFVLMHDFRAIITRRSFYALRVGKESS